MEILAIDNTKSVHTFNRFEEKGHVECYHWHFTLIGLTKNNKYDIGVLGIEV